MTKEIKAVARGFATTKPEKPYGLTACVPVLVVAWARWNRTIDAVACELERVSKVHPVEFIQACGADRKVPFDDLEMGR